MQRNASASELKKLAMPFGRDDPFVQRWFRQVEDEEQRAREKRHNHQQRAKQRQPQQHYRFAR
jgi:hypothetical protein